jgi:hypothetical protein
MFGILRLVLIVRRQQRAAGSGYGSCPVRIDRAKPREGRHDVFGARPARCSPSAETSACGRARRSDGVDDEFDRCGHSSKGDRSRSESHPDGRH